MTPSEQEHPINWGYLIGRLEGQETQMQDVKAVVREVRDEQRETNRRVDRLYHAAITIGGGIIVALIGIIISLIILIIRS